MKRACFALALLLLAIALLGGCAPAAQPTAPTSQETPMVEPSPSFRPTPTVQASPAGETPAEPTTVPQPTAPGPTAAPLIEQRVIELEWPARLRLGESDVLRLALVPSKDGYTAQAEFEEHPLATQEIQIKHPAGYSLYGIARLHGVGFDIAPSGDQRRLIPPQEAISWRWSIAARQAGQQRLTVELALRWEPEPGSPGPVGESLALGRSLDVNVVSFMGMTRTQALGLGIFSLLLGGALGAVVLYGRRPVGPASPETVAPNRDLQLELAPHIQLSQEERQLTQSMFARYDRLILDNEFYSGYSGARTFLARPLFADGRADAATIVKLGERSAMLGEFHNYETYVKDRLPPVTARIQRAPVAAPRSRLAALQYTFIAEPGQPPRSLRQDLLERGDPAPLQRLFETFGPHWWLQRQPYTFRMAQEYDRLLPPHWLLAPAAEGKARQSIGEDPHAVFQTGEIVRLGDFSRRELRLGGKSWSLGFPSAPGEPEPRLHWLSPQPPKSGALGIIRASRMDLLGEWTKDFERFGLPDPLEQLPNWLNTTLQGARSTIHGDLNLENVLVGPGELVWLIDFASTREGHTQLDFAHLSAEIAAHVLAPQAGSPGAFLQRIQAGDALLESVQDLSRRCLFDPAQDQERRLALAVTCLGALKYANLTPLGRHGLYLLAASLV